MKKKITPEQIDNALRICKRVGMTYTGNFIFGDIAETKETYRETLDYWKKNPYLTAGNISLGQIMLYQGSFIYKHAVDKRIIKDEIQFIEDQANQEYPDPINFTDGMTNEEYHHMIAELKEANAIPKYYAFPIENIQTEDIHEIKIGCPFCKEITTYKNYYISPDFGRTEICCRKCRAKYIIPSPRLRLKFFVVRVFGFRITYGIARWIYYAADYLPDTLKNKIKKNLAV